MTLEDLAEAIQRDFIRMATKEDLERFAIKPTKQDLAELRKEMATKQDLAELREEMGTRFATRSEVQPAVSSAKEEIMGEIGKIKYAKEIDEIRNRVDRVEADVDFEGNPPGGGMRFVRCSNGKGHRPGVPRNPRRSRTSTNFCRWSS